MSVFHGWSPSNVCYLLSMKEILNCSLQLRLWQLPQWLRAHAAGALNKLSSLGLLWSSNRLENADVLQQTRPPQVQALAGSYPWRVKAV